MKKLAAAILLSILAQPACADIAIGVSAPLTGPAASVGEISLPGLKQAVADINAAGGIKGEKLSLDIMDDACDPKQAVAVAGKFAARQPVAVVGLSCSGATQAAADIYDEEGIPFITSVASLPEITQAGHHNLLRPASRDDNDATAAVGFIAGRYQGKKVAVIHDKSTWGKGTAELIVEDLKQKGFSVDMLSLNQGEQDFNALVSRLKQSGYDVVVPSVMMREAGLLVRQMKEQGYKPAIVGTMPLGMADFVTIAGAARDGVYFTNARVTDEGKALLAKLGKANDMVSVYNVQAYAAAQILAQAIGRAGIKAEPLLADLHAQTFRTVLGDLKFDAKGDINDMKFDIMQYQGGKPVKIQP